MDREELLTLLSRQKGRISGEELSRALGVTRSAVWKEMQTLRQAGWPIVSTPRLGYRLDGPPPVLSAPYLSARLSADSLFAGKIQVLDRVDSTNTRLKALAAAGAPAGSVVIAEEQTGGRGTHGRSFVSPRGEGLYLSILLRPQVPISELLTLTGWAAAAFRQGVQAASGAPVEIKWLNDLYLNGRKLAGILTELSLLGESGEPDYVVIGIGVNVSQTAQTFREQGLSSVAASLAGEGYPTNRSTLALALLEAADRLVRAFPAQRDLWLADYREHCLTPGRRVSFQAGDKLLTGLAHGVSGRFALLVSGDDGGEYTVSSSTVTVLD